MTKEIKETLNNFFFMAGWLIEDIADFYEDNREDLNELTLPPLIEYVVFSDRTDTGKAFSTLEEAEEEVKKAHATGDTTDILLTLDIDPADTAISEDNMCIAFEVIYSDTAPLVSANYH